MTNRLEELRREFDKGQQEMAQLERRRQELRDTMLRISGAIQVLEELVAQKAEPASQEALVSQSA